MYLAVNEIGQAANDNQPCMQRHCLRALSVVFAHYSLSGEDYALLGHVLASMDGDRLLSESIALLIKEPQ